ncbi:hypothetical protein SEVIR_2G355601v4 [Setaria viridis]|uniref:Myb/SANT-like domain-containing protein n=1 Tax=Setaria viridis TaxID=4556 RepID=A0A4U6VYT3_SETVI|nr:uncharacterized protein LOC117844888 [Setaria viridis]TKW35188.1 hypothetical protein SEVIR_2G355601v2 [Setaria viridis]
MSASNGKKKYRGYLTWTDDMDQALLDVLVEHHNNGDHTANGWKPHVYTAAVRNVREKCNVDITKDHVMSRCKTFDKHCNVLGRILAHDGFEWDQDRNKLVIHNEDAWSRYIEKNKAAACYQHKVIKNWDAISLIFSRDHAATSEDVSAGAENGQEVAMKVAEDVRHHTPSPSSPSTSGPSSQYRPGPPMLTQSNKQGRMKRFRTKDALFCMSGSIKNSFQISMKSNETQEEPKSACPKEIFAALQAIPNLARDDLLRAYCILTSSDRKFECLMALPMDMRKDWLLIEIGKK